MNNAVFGKTVKNVRKNGNFKLVTTKRRRNYLVSEPNYHTTKFSAENSLAIEMRKNEMLISKPVYVDLSNLDLNKTVMSEFWSDYVKAKYVENKKLRYMDTDCFIVLVKIDDIYKDLLEDVETSFWTSIFELERTLPKGKNKQ